MLMIGKIYLSDKKALRYASVFGNEKIGCSEHPIFKGLFKLFLFCWTFP